MLAQVGMEMKANAKKLFIQISIRKSANIIVQIKDVKKLIKNVQIMVWLILMPKLLIESL